MVGADARSIRDADITDVETSTVTGLLAIESRPVDGEGLFDWEAAA